MACVAEDDTAFGALEIVVFQVCRKVDIGSLSYGVGDHETA